MTAMDHDITIKYDRESRVLYISNGEPTTGEDCLEVGDTLYRRDVTGKLVGITLLHYTPGDGMGDLDVASAIAEILGQP